MKLLSPLSFALLFMSAASMLSAMSPAQHGQKEYSLIEIAIAQQHLQQFNNIATEESRRKIMLNPVTAKLLEQLAQRAAQGSPKGNQSPVSPTSTSK